MLDRGMTVARLNFSHGDHKVSSFKFSPIISRLMEKLSTDLEKPLREEKISNALLCLIPRVLRSEQENLSMENP